MGAAEDEEDAPLLLIATGGWDINNADMVSFVVAGCWL
jgi:hypothetical protein